MPQVRNAIGAGLDIENDFPNVDKVWKHCLTLPPIIDTVRCFNARLCHFGERCCISPALWTHFCIVLMRPFIFLEPFSGHVWSMSALLRG